MKQKYDNRRLRVELFKLGLTDEKMANKLGIARQTFNRKVNTGHFSQEELKKILDVLIDLDSSITPDIFF